MTFTREKFASPDDDAGIFIDGLGSALVTWTAMQERPVTIAEAALAFNTTPDVVREAVADASWIYIDEHRQTLELDGD